MKKCSSCRRPIRSRTSPITATSAATVIHSARSTTGHTSRSRTSSAVARHSRPALPHDGFLLEQSPEGTFLIGRIEGRLYQLEQLANGNGYCYHDGTACVTVSPDGRMAVERNHSRLRAPARARRRPLSCACDAAARRYGFDAGACCQYADARESLEAVSKPRAKALRLIKSAETR